MAKRSQISKELERSNARYFDDLVASTVTLEDDNTLSGTNAFTGNVTVNTGTLNYRENISLLVDAEGAGAIRTALTLADSGTHFIVPALTSGTQTIALPAVTAANVGFTVRFTMLGTAAQIFSVDTAASGDKIILIEPDGDGTHTIGTFNKARMTAAATLGASFRIVMISATAATAFSVMDMQNSLGAGTGEVVGAN